MMGMLWWMIQNTVVAAVLAGIVATISRWARPSPAICHALWLAVLIKLIAPPLVYWPWTADALWQPISQRFFDSKLDSLNDSVEILPAEPTVTTSLPEHADGLPSEVFLVPVMPEEKAQFSAVPPIQTEPAHEVSTPESLEAEPCNPGWWNLNSVESLAVRIWLFGALAMAAWQLSRLDRFRRSLAESNSPPEWLANQVVELASGLRIRPPEILVVPRIASPMIWGLGRARLIWPGGQLDHLPKSSRQGVLLHELAHLRRRDHWVSWLQLLGGCLCWCNPLFWFVSRQVRENAELACDAWVVTTIPGGRRAYAEALIEVAQILSQAEVPAPALSLGVGRRREFERRLIMIMGAGFPCKPSMRGLVVVGLLSLAALPGWSQVPPPAPQQNPGPPAAVPTPPLSVTPPVISEVPTPGDANPFAPAPSLVPSTPSLVPDNGPGDPDARLKAIEQQLQALLKEVKGMRNGGGNKSTTPSAVHSVPPLPRTPPGVRYVPGNVAFPGHTVPPGQTAPRPVMPPAADPSGEITLTRATYELPSDKAKALSDLLQGYKGPEVTMKIEGDKMTVTTSPGAQHAIGQFIRFLQGKPIAPQYHYVPVTSYQAVPAVGN
jgi:beta-lactamase regulating signal transducer with metallopeptidase domain